MTDFIPGSGGCTITLNAWEQRAPIRWASRGESAHPADNGWRFLSAIDTSEYLSDSANWRIATYNDVCAIEPAVINIYDFPVGSEITFERVDGRILIIDGNSGREITSEYFYVPPQFRVPPGS